MDNFKFLYSNNECELKSFYILEIFSFWIRSEFSSFKKIYHLNIENNLNDNFNDNLNHLNIECVLGITEQVNQLTHIFMTIFNFIFSHDIRHINRSMFTISKYF